MIPKISSYEDLHKRIEYLDGLKEEQELVLKEDLKNFYASMQPANMIKHALAKMKEDRELKHDAAQLGLNMALEYIIGKIFKKNSSLGAYLKSTVAEQAAAFVLDKYGDKIQTVVSGLLTKFVSLIQRRNS
ncbi:MAG: hypothetical protein JST26_06770 [Bacteroidetes bacterium]|nr:hypothetical protein [Bacteroidota bacterium]